MSTLSGKFIKEARRRKGLSQADLARELGLSSYHAVQSWEAERTRPSWKNEMHLRELLGLHDQGYEMADSVDDLLTE